MRQRDSKTSIGRDGRFLQRGFLQEYAPLLAVALLPKPPSEDSEFLFCWQTGREERERERDRGKNYVCAGECLTPVVITSWQLTEPSVGVTTGV